MVRTHRIVLLSVLVPILASSGIAADEPLRSGLQPGEEVTGLFEPMNVTGPYAGETHCLVCENGAAPVVMIFAKKVSDSLLSLLVKLDEATSKHQKQELGCFVVFLNDQPELPKQLQDLATKHKLKHVILSTFDPSGPDGFKVNKEAEITVVMYHDYAVKANHSFAARKMTNASSDKILADLPKLVTPK